MTKSGLALKTLSCASLIALSACGVRFGTIEEGELSPSTISPPPVPSETSPPDTQPPTITHFSLPATSTTLAVNGITLEASDNVGIVGYYLDVVNSKPTIDAVGWTTSPQTNYRFSGIDYGSSGTKTLYAWVKDATGNVSDALSASVTINLPPAVPLNACGNLNAANTTYILESDVISAGTCFTVSANNVTLDLNGHTVTYNTAAGDNVYGVLVSWNKSFIRITNGSVVQGAGKGYMSNAIHSQQGNSLELDHLTLSYEGDNISGIAQVGSGAGTSHISVHDNIIRPNGSKRAGGGGIITHFGDFGAISVGGTGGNIRIENNDIQGKGYQGIRFGYSTPLTSTLRITGNTIKMAAPVRDAYAIVVASGVNSDIGFEVANNTIVQSAGRGIIVQGNVNADSPGPGNGSVHDNSIEVREPRDSGEYNGPGNGIGIALRFGAHNVRVYNNSIKVYGGQNACPPAFATNLGSDCLGVAIKVIAGTNAVNNQIYGNTISVETTDAALPVIGLYGVGIADGTTVFRNNTVTSNGLLVDVNGTDGAGSNFVFTSNLFIKGANPQNFRSIRAGYWTNASLGNVFLDNTWNNGASGDDVLLAISGGANYSLYSKWTLAVSAKTESNVPVPGATVTAISGTETVTGTTNEAGEAQLPLTQYHRFGTTFPQTTNYTHHTPHTVSVSKPGFESSTSVVTMNEPKSLTATLR